MKIAIVGAGLAGLTCAERLVAQGHDITVFDKARGPGGRMSTRRVETTGGMAFFDHGAPWFTVQDLRFRRAALEWEAQGLVARWPAAGEEVFVGVPGMNRIVKDLVARHNVFFNCHVHGLARRADGWCVLGDAASLGPYDAVILAVPMEQAMGIVALYDLELARLGSRMRARACWTGMFAFAEPLPIAADVLRGHGLLHRLIRNSAKPGRTGLESWVLQADAEWSQTNLERSADDVLAEMQSAFAAVLDGALQQPLYAAAHRWRYATYAGLAEDALWNEQLNLGICGDWLIGGDVEAAWLSGRAMAGQLQIAALRRGTVRSRTG